jgi:hypothetical protein
VAAVSALEVVFRAMTVAAGPSSLLVGGAVCCQVSRLVQITGVWL